MKWLIGVLILLLLTVVFTLQNAQVVAVTFFFWHIELSLVVVLVVTLLIGLVAGLVFGAKAGRKTKTVVQEKPAQSLPVAENEPSKETQNAS